MRFGLTITSNDGPDMDPRERVENHVQRALWARDCGFATIAVGHRYSFWPAASDDRGAALVTSRYQPLLLLSHVAAHLGSDVNYATAVLVSTGLHPVQLAEDIATLDAFCAGGLRVGIGLGWLPYELEAFGVERSTRVRRFEELLVSTCDLLTGDPVSFDGEFFRFERAPPDRTAGPAAAAADLGRRLSRCRRAPRGPAGRRVVDVGAHAGP